MKILFEADIDESVKPARPDIILRALQQQFGAIDWQIIPQQPAAPEAVSDLIEFDGHLRFIQRVLEGDIAPADKATALKMVREIRTCVRSQHATQQPSEKPNHGSLPQSANSKLPAGCYCEIGKCAAPKPNWCRDTNKRDGTAAQAKGEGDE